MLTSLKRSGLVSDRSVMEKLESTLATVCLAAMHNE